MASTTNGQVLEFYYDISCPFAYIASTRVEALAQRTGVKLIWRPVLLGAVYRATAAPQGAAGSASDVFNPTKKSISGQSFQRTLRRFKIKHNSPRRHPQKTTAALRLIYHVPNEERPALSKAFFKAYWVDGKDVTDRNVLLEVAKSSGAPSAKHFTDAEFDDAEDRVSLEKATADIIERGSPGVPAFWIPNEIWTDITGEKRLGRLYWGQDRMHFVELMLISLKNGISLSQVPALESLMPRCQHALKPGKVKLEFFFDFSSPWAFLGWTQLDRLRRTFGDQLEIVEKPFLLGILFREIGAPMLPMMAVSDQKRIYMRHDLGDWVRFWNAINAQNGKLDKNIEFQWPTQFPIRTPTALRCAIVDPSCIPFIYRACWENNDNVSDDSVLSDILDKAGFQGSELVKRASNPKVKDTLRRFTQEAKDIGLCGVPTYRVSRKGEDGGWKHVGDMIWGQDETAIVEDLIAGWDEATSTQIADVGPEHARLQNPSANL